MSLRARIFVWSILLCSTLIGCSPIADTKLDEQNNRHYQAGKKKLTGLDYEGATAAFERALEDNPRFALAHYELGLLFEQHMHDYASALYHYNKALKLRPSGYPADNIQQRIPACKQELVKADSVAVMNPGELRQTETLRQENLALRRQLENLQSYITSMSQGQATGPPPMPEAQPNPRTSRSSPAPATETTQPGSSTSGARTSDTAGRTREPAGVARTTRMTRTTPTTTPTTPRSRTSRTTTTSSPRSSSSSSRTARSPRDPRISARERRTTTERRSGTRLHKVRSRETMYSISRRYGISVRSLQSANPRVSPQRLKVGQTLRIPAY